MKQNSVLKILYNIFLGGQFSRGEGGGEYSVNIKIYYLLGKFFVKKIFSKVFCYITVDSL